MCYACSHAYPCYRCYRSGQGGSAMMVSVSVAECDGCGARVESDIPPDRWITIHRNDVGETLYCTSLCFAGHEGLEPVNVADTRAARYGLVHTDLAMLEHIARGRTNHEIGSKLFLAESTVKNRLVKIFLKLHVTSRMQAALLSGHLGLIDTVGLSAEVGQD